MSPVSQGDSTTMVTVKHHASSAQQGGPAKILALHRAQAFVKQEATPLLALRQWVIALHAYKASTITTGKETPNVSSVLQAGMTLGLVSTLRANTPA
eukprot:COSAG06_NODE_32637_length_503_cov_0.512376_2_plen_97_part_00